MSLFDPGMMPEMPEDQPAVQPDEADMGRGGDTVLGHLTPGEVVIPLNVLSQPGVMAKLTNAFGSAAVDMDKFTVGNPANSINPETGNPEFSWLSEALGGGARGLLDFGDDVLGIETGRSPDEVEQRTKEYYGKERSKEAARASAERERMREAGRIAKEESLLKQAQIRARAKESQLNFNQRMQRIIKSKDQSKDVAGSQGSKQQAQAKGSFDKDKYIKETKRAEAYNAALNKRRPT